MTRLPSLFVSHGAPSFALEPGIAGAGLAELGRRLPRPQAVLVISPHWMSAEPQATVAPRPATIHDFGGFDPALHELRYPAPGAPTHALRALERLRDAGWAGSPAAGRGLDHGAWVPLRHLYPAADVPVFQVSMPFRLDARAAWEMGRILAPLADEGVLIVGSGSLTHNLYEFRHARGAPAAYAAEFTAWIREAVLAGEHSRLREALTIAPHARRAHPTPEHFLPLLIAAAAGGDANAHLIEGGIVHGVLSMDAFVFGAPPFEPPPAAS